MKHFTLIRQLCVVIMMLLCCVSAQAADLITQQITVNVETAGTLETKITQERFSLLTNLKLTGELNGTDILYLRSCGSNITKLDLEGAKIVKGGKPYHGVGGIGGSTQYYTSDNSIGACMFYATKMSKLSSIILPASVTSIGGGGHFIIANQFHQSPSHLV